MLLSISKYILNKSRISVRLIINIYSCYRGIHIIPSIMFKQSVKVITSLAAGFSGMVYFLPNSVFLPKLKDVFQLYKYTEPVPVSEKVTKLMEEVLNDMKIEPDDRSKILLFTCFGFDNYYAGSIWKNKFLGGLEQAIVGVPVNFGWDAISKQDKDEIVVKNKTLNWSSEAGQLLENSLILSDKGKKFALAQQVENISRCDPVLKGLILSVLVTTSLGIVRAVNNHKKFQPKQFKLIRYGLISMGWIFVYTMWIGFNDVYTCSNEYETDKRVAELGKEYIEGGLEYYDKSLNRNIAMKTLQEEDGEKVPFSLFGNEELVFRQKHLPLTTRRDYFKQLLEE